MPAFGSTGVDLVPTYFLILSWKSLNFLGIVVRWLPGSSSVDVVDHEGSSLPEHRP